LNTTEIVKQQAEIAIGLQKEISTKVAELKIAQDKITDTWKQVESLMLKHDIKSIKGDWGILTIAERLNWSIGPELPPRFFKTVPDTTKISTIFRLEGKAPRGATPSYTKYLTKRIKGADNG
jgi:hypothetical protein